MKVSYKVFLIIFTLLLLNIEIFGQNKTNKLELIPYLKGNKWGFSDKNKKIIINCIYDYVEPFQNGYSEVTLGEETFYINTKGEKVELPPDYKKQEKQKEERDLIPFHENDLMGYKNQKGEIVIKPQFQNAYEFSEGFAAVKKNNKWGYINKKGKFVIHPKYDVAYSFKNGLAKVGIEGMLVYIDTTGKEYFEPMTCETKNKDWLKGGIRLLYAINYFDPIFFDIHELSDQIKLSWSKDNRKGFDILITKEALQNAYKHLNYIYRFSDINLLELKDEISVFVSRKMFSEMEKKKSITYFPYYRPENPSVLTPVKMKYKGNKNLCVKYNEEYINLDTIVYESDTGEKLIVLNNKDFPLIIQMRLDFSIYLLSIENIK